MEGNDGEKRYRIAELCEETGVTRRTVHYYIGRGLLPPAEGAGLASSYTEAHVERIRAIRRMQEAYLPLEEIRRRLDGESGEWIGSGSPTAAEAAEAAPPGRTSGRTERRMVRIVLEHGVELSYPETEEAEEYAKRLVRWADRRGKES
jgi:DNA-binding transcriptional MerR regulator